MRSILLALCLVLVSADTDHRQQQPPDLPRIDASPNEFDMTGVLWDFNEGRFLLECRMIGPQYGFTDKRVYAAVGQRVYDTDWIVERVFRYDEPTQGVCIDFLLQNAETKKWAGTAFRHLKLPPPQFTWKATGAATRPSVFQKQ